MKKLKITEMNRLTTEEFKEQSKTLFVVVLENVRSKETRALIIKLLTSYSLPLIPQKYEET